jgi:hypothetical protein
MMGMITWSKPNYPLPLFLSFPIFLLSSPSFNAHVINGPSLSLSLALTHTGLVRTEVEKRRTYKKEKRKKKRKEKEM